MDIDKQNELEDVLDELEMRKGEASGAPKSKKWGEAKKRDRLNALTEMEITEDSPDRAAYNRYVLYLIYYIFFRWCPLC